VAASLDAAQHVPAISAATTTARRLMIESAASDVPLAYESLAGSTSPLARNSQPGVWRSPGEEAKIPR
jgi:hypothetical protein